MERILGMIGLAKRAGCVVGGDFAVTSAVKDKKAKLVIIAENASSNTKKKIENSCEQYGVDYVEFSDTYSLGRYTSSDVRATIAITDTNFAEAIVAKIKENSCF